MSEHEEKDIKELIKNMEKKSYIKDFVIFKLDELLHSTLPKNKAKALLDSYFEKDIKTVLMLDVNTVLFFFKDYTVLVKPASILTIQRVEDLVEIHIFKRNPKKRRYVYDVFKEEKEEEDEVEDFSRIFINKILETLVYLIGKEATKTLVEKVGGREKLLERESFDVFLKEVEKMLGKRTRDLLLNLIEI